MAWRTAAQSLATIPGMYKVMVRAISRGQARYLRLRGQRLHPGASAARTGVAPLVAGLCGVQAQDPLAAAMALRVRTSGLIAADVEGARVHERSIVRTWGLRGTLHLLASQDLGWLLPILGPVFVRKSGRRYSQLGLNEKVCDRALRLTRSILADRGALTRAELAEQLAKHGIPTEGQATYHLIRYAGLKGALCYGPEREGEPSYTLLADWVKVGEAMPEDRARAELARRYLETYGPARLQDLASWSGLPMSTVQAGVDLISDELIMVKIGDSPAWMMSDQAAWLEEFRPESVDVRLLSGYDPYLLGYRSRDLSVPAGYAQRIHPGGGVLRPTLLVNGTAAGTWQMKRTIHGLIVTIEPFDALAPEVISALEVEIQDLGRFLELKATPDIEAPTSVK